MNSSSISDKRLRFPPQIIAHAVWLYVRFNLSLREVEEMLLARGTDVSYETIRRLVIKFGPVIARNLRLSQDPPSDVWRLDEAIVKISGRKYWLWRGRSAWRRPGRNTPTETGQADRKTAVARPDKASCFIPRRIITDKLRSYGAAKREVAPGLDHWSHKGLNNRAENSHLPFRKRERTMQGYRSPGGLQRFVAIHSAIRNCFCVPVSRRSALTIRYHRLEAFDAWDAASRAA